LALNRIKMRHLQCFVEVARRHSVTEAAVALALTQPAVSKTLKELEEEVGGRLLHRNRGGASLTELGEIFFRRASTSISALRQGVDEVARAGTRETQPVVVGAMQETLAYLLPRAVALFKAAHPRTGVRIVHDSNAELLARLRRGEIDFVVGGPMESPELEGLSFEALYSDGVNFVVRPGHPLTRLDTVDVAAIARYPMHLQFAGTTIRRTIERFLIASGVRIPANTIESHNYPFARSLARMTDTILVSIVGAVREDLQAGILAELPIDTTPMSSPVGMTSDPGVPNSPLASELMDLVRAVAMERDWREGKTAAPL
jgi:LysR family pca operon transcriptional activator